MNNATNLYLLVIETHSEKGWKSTHKHSIIMMVRLVPGGGLFLVRGFPEKGRKQTVMVGLVVVVFFLQRFSPFFPHKQQTTIKQQTTNNKQQTTNNKQQTTNNKQQTTNNKQQTTNNKQQTTNNKQQKGGRMDFR